MLGFLAIPAVCALVFVAYCCWWKKKREGEQDRGKDDVIQKIENDPKIQEPTEGVGKIDYQECVITVIESPESKVEQDRGEDDMI